MLRDTELPYDDNVARTFRSCDVCKHKGWGVSWSYLYLFHPMLLPSRHHINRQPTFMMMVAENFSKFGWVFDGPWTLALRAGRCWNHIRDGVLRYLFLCCYWKRKLYLAVANLYCALWNQNFGFISTCSRHRPYTSTRYKCSEKGG